jgi:FixJ family two-component response regulator
MDGLQLLQWFSGEQIPVVVITGVRNPQLITQVMHHGAQGFLSKGVFSRAVLEQALADAMRDMAQGIKEKRLSA